MFILKRIIIVFLWICFSVNNIYGLAVPSEFERYRESKFRSVSFEVGDPKEIKSLSWPRKSILKQVVVDNTSSVSVSSRESLGSLRSFVSSFGSDFLRELETDFFNVVKIGETLELKKESKKFSLISLMSCNTFFKIDEEGWRISPKREIEFFSLLNKAKISDEILSKYVSAKDTLEILACNDSLMKKQENVDWMIELLCLKTDANETKVRDLYEEVEKQVGCGKSDELNVFCLDLMDELCCLNNNLLDSYMSFLSNISIGKVSISKFSHLKLLFLNVLYLGSILKKDFFYSDEVKVEAARLLRSLESAILSGRIGKKSA